MGWLGLNPLSWHPVVVLTSALGVFLIRVVIHIHSVDLAALVPINLSKVGGYFNSFP